MDMTVVKGNPTDDEVAALTMVLAQLQAEAKADRGPGDLNLWGRPGKLRHNETIFNPGAFNNVTYF
ncbi:Acyl-CoA carboxylase epsilon subunit [Corynebacterium mycetoides]|uniref:Acyl-CoA carboxylase epsilon subunit n=1 Tax=Corynebacterium mycetoides TaxID=38302 RepID=A0A1G9QPJ5_9CORY|nr:acyl-CoA carboxylase subunit epsilon [Corynebacterium mycetoides]SDM12934.1 Acyl-CoA carboxylase epsilon subunit [Corynebacterium mycetoides]